MLKVLPAALVARRDARRVPGCVGIAAGVAGCALALAACGSAPAAQTTPLHGGSPAASATSASPAASSSQSPPGSATGACATAQLQVALTNSGALGGQAGAYLQFTNGGSRPCQLSGWPAVTGLTAAGQATTLKHAQSTMFGAWIQPSSLPVLTLQPGNSAYAVVAADDHPAGSGGCGAPYVKLQVTPPGASGSVVISGWLPGADSYLPACPAVSGSPTAEVSAVTPLSSLPH
jgi:Protein of unknown function (DUF4232)